jgi:acid phosphatase type 7
MACAALVACRVPGPTAGAVTIVAAGDIADCGKAPAGQSMAARTAALVKPEDAAVLTLGDNTYPVGAPREFAECFEPTWGVFKQRIRPSPGNHDYQTAGADGYFGYFGDRAGPARRGYYSYTLDGWHLIALNSNVDARAGSEQHRWLLDDLRAAADRPCTLAYWHHPRFSSGPHGSDPRMHDVYAALHDAGVEIVLAAHDHVYERMAPHDATGAVDRQRGIRSFTVGTGGARLYRFKSPHPASEMRDASTHGVLRVTLHEGRYEWGFVPVDGGPVRDAGAADCRR